MKITATVQTIGFNGLDDAERLRAIREFEEKKHSLKENADMIVVADKRVWIIVNEYEIGSLTATFLLPEEY